MKLIKKIPPENKQTTMFLNDQAWIRLKEPKSVSAAILWSMPISILLMLSGAAWCYYLYPPFQELLSGEQGFSMEITIGIEIVYYLLGMFLCLVIHELIHAAFIPKVWKSDKTYWGFNGLFGFVFTEEVLSKKRMVVISLMPLLILSFAIPLLLAGAGLLNGYLVFLSVLNAGGACVDVLNVILILSQVPKGGDLVANGYATFYKNTGRKA
ncbi:DUF3267 domain-containing protein [Clostridium boliviensis]|uniref:DUF3267 domain-containing protein n=1 Tax=Clostridium boliviensis TaxID=318465 RepID=A0ABU4GS59_9CLOT|nr:DUF3267 domain-containing protein [Clostridium boliviensis]MDW2800469.1 DUF3267 domain-containing protein [Clostridium boliviensis]